MLTMNLTSPVSDEIRKEIYSNIEKIIDEVDLIILSDYIMGVLTRELIIDIVKLANRHDKIILMDPKGQDFSKYSGVDILVPDNGRGSHCDKILQNSPDKRNCG